MPVSSEELLSRPPRIARLGEVSLCNGNVEARSTEGLERRVETKVRRLSTLEGKHNSIATNIKSIEDMLTIEHVRKGIGCWSSFLDLLCSSTIFYKLL